MSETPERASLWAARKAFVTGLLAARAAYPLRLPRLPLQELIDRRMGAVLADRGVVMHRGTPVRQISGDGRGAAGVVLADGTRQAFDFVIATVPWGNITALLSDALRTAWPALRSVEAIRPGAITAVHLWFDRPLCDVPHAVLVDRTSQWMFADGPVEGAEACRHYQVVISASHALADRDPDRILDCVRRDLEAVWPAARGLRLLHHRVITQPAAVFSVAPGLRANSAPGKRRRWRISFWRAIGRPPAGRPRWKGAVRSGRLAVEAMLAALGRPERLLTPDLPRGRLARWWCGKE